MQFYVFYLLGAFTDMIDGTIARKLGRELWQVFVAAVIVIGCIATFSALQEGHYIRTGREME